MKKSFRDHQVSLVSEDVKELNIFFDNVIEVCGSSKKEPTKSEKDNNHIQTFRRGTYLQQNISSGSVISKDDLIEKRPLNEGLSYLELIGKKVNKDLRVGQFVLEEDINE